MISEILISLYGTKHQLFHRWNMIRVWNTHCSWKAWTGLTAAVRAAKPENHIYCSHSKQAATNTQALILMRFWMLCSLPKWLLEYFVGFALLGQKLTSRAVHMENIFRNVGRGKFWWGHQNDSASASCWSHHSQNVHVSQANSPTPVPSSELLVPCSMKLYFIPIRFQPLWFSGSSSPF